MSPMMPDGHLSPETLGYLLEEGSAHPHLAGCTACRTELDALRQTARRLAPRVPEPSAARWGQAEAALAGTSAAAAGRRRLARWAPRVGSVAAGLLLALVWALLRGTPPAPQGTAAPPATLKGDGGPLYLSPDCWTALDPGARAIQAGDVLRLESGRVTLCNLGWRQVSVETPLGTLRGAPGEPVQAEIRVSVPDRSLASLFLGSAQAGDARELELEVSVRLGILRLETPGRPPVEIAAGRRMSLPAGGEVCWGDVPKAVAPAWILQRLDPPLVLSGNPASFPFPALPVGDYVWEMEVQAQAASSSLGVAFETGGRLRLWHLGSEPWDGPARWQLLRVSVRGDWAEVWADGRLLFSTGQAARRFQDAPVAKPGLVVWGSAQVRQIRGGPLP